MQDLQWNMNEDPGLRLCQTTNTDLVTLVCGGYASSHHQELHQVPHRQTNPSYRQDLPR